MHRSAQFARSFLAADVTGPSVTLHDRHGIDRFRLGSVGFRTLDAFGDAFEVASGAKLGAEIASFVAVNRQKFAAAFPACAFCLSRRFVAGRAMVGTEFGIRLRLKYSATFNALALPIDLTDFS